MMDSYIKCKVLLLHVNCAHVNCALACIMRGPTVNPETFDEGFIFVNNVKKHVCFIEKNQS